MSGSTHYRAGFVCIMLAVVLSIYSARLVHLQVGKHREYGGLAAEKTAQKKVVAGERGRITDCHGEPLAVNVPIYSVVVDGKLLAELESGDEVITTGGIFGVITNVKDDRFVVRIAENTKIEVGKGFIQSVTKKPGASEKK